MVRWLCALFAAALVHINPVLAVAKDDFSGSTFRFQGYDRNGVFISEGDLATDTGGNARFKFDFSTNPALQGRRLDGRWRLQNGRFCYNVRINNTPVDACSRTRSSTQLLWADGSSNILTRRSGPQKAVAAAKSSAKPKSGEATRQATLSRSDRWRIQQALNAKGHQSGTPDGVFGARTAKAIANWQASVNAEATGRLTPAQAATLLEAAPKTDTSSAAACATPMTETQHANVSNMLRKIMALTDVRRKNVGKGGNVKITRCRQISYTPIGGKKPISGPLSALYTELNSSWHDVAGYGLIPNAGDYFIRSSAGLINHYEPDAGRMSAWMKRVNRETVALLAAAGYPKSLSQTKRTIILNRDLEEVGKPDLRVGLKTLENMMRSGVGGAPAVKGTCERKRSYICRLPCANNSRPDPKRFPSISVSACSNRAASEYAEANKLRLCKASGFDRTRHLPPLNAYCE